MVELVVWEEQILAVSHLYSDFLFVREAVDIEGKEESIVLLTLPFAGFCDTTTSAE
jgi:hypothetical protein